MEHFKYNFDMLEIKLEIVIDFFNVEYAKIQL